MNASEEGCPQHRTARISSEPCPACATVTDLDARAIVAKSDRVPTRTQSHDAVPEDIHAEVSVAGEARTVALRCANTTIGRAPGNDICLPDDVHASRFHAAIVFENGHFWLQDLDSTNGTLLNGSPVLKMARLVSRDKIRVGHTEILFALKRG